MGKLLDCPHCEAKGVPVRIDASTCGSARCKKREQRRKKKEQAEK